MSWIFETAPSFAFVFLRLGLGDRLLRPLDTADFRLVTADAE